MVEQPLPRKIQRQTQVLAAHLIRARPGQDHAIHATGAKRMLAECFTGKTLDAIALVRTADMALGHGQAHAGMAKIIPARKNNNPVA